MKGRLHLFHPHNQRLQRIQAPTYERLQVRLAGDHSESTEKPLNTHYDWGHLLIGQTCPDAEELARDLLQEAPNERDIALYVVVPQQVLTHAPQQLFLNPSGILRLRFTDYRPAHRPPRDSRIHRVHAEEDWATVNRLYLTRDMLPVQTERLSPCHQGGPIYWLTEDADIGVIVNTVMGLNHAKTFQDSKGGSSLWCLMVDPQYNRPDVGETLVRHLVEHFISRELVYLDLPVLHNNQRVKTLYCKLGPRKLATFTIKRKNGVNQSLFLDPGPEEDLNPYARITVDEAHRCGIEVCINDAESGLFILIQGGQQIRYRKSLSNLTTAMSMTPYQDKILTHHALQHVDLRQPWQRLAGSVEGNAAFLAEHGSLVVESVDGEQGQGVAVDLRTVEGIEETIEAARHFDSRVLLESYHASHDLCVLVIGYEVAAAAIRRPAAMIGGGWHSIRELIGAQSRRRQIATGGESRIPLDYETECILRATGYDYDDMLFSGKHLAVQRTASLYTGGILEDVTDALRPIFREAAIQTVRALEIPVVGLNFLVETADQPNYVIIKVNERADPANHESWPTAERFVNLLSPLSREMPP